MDTDGHVFYRAEDYIIYSPTDRMDGFTVRRITLFILPQMSDEHRFGIFKVCFNKNNKNPQQYFQEAFGFTLFAVILCPRASSLSSTYSKQCRRARSAS